MLPFHVTVLIYVNPLRVKDGYIRPRCFLRATTDIHSNIQTTEDEYIHPVAVSSAAVGIISETYIYVQNCHFQ